MDKIEPSDEWKIASAFDYVNDPNDHRRNACSDSKAKAWDSTYRLMYRLSLDGIPSKLTDQSNQIVVEVPSNIEEIRAQFRDVLRKSRFSHWQKKTGKKEIIDFVGQGKVPNRLSYVLGNKWDDSKLFKAARRKLFTPEQITSKGENVKYLASLEATYLVPGQNAYELTVRGPVRMLLSLEKSPLGAVEFNGTSVTGRRVNFVALTEHVKII